MNVLESLEDGEDGERPAFLLVKDSEAEARTWYKHFKPFVWDAGSENLKVKVFERFGGLWCFAFDALPKGVLPSKAVPMAVTSQNFHGRHVRGIF